MNNNVNDDNRSATAHRPSPVTSAHQPSSALPWKLKGADFSNAWAVDAACSGNPGPIEYQGIDLDTGERIFHFGPVYGTNNIGEFLAIVHALALMKQKGIRKTIFSDSFTAQTWIKKRHCKTQLERNEKTEPLFAIIDRAHNWLRINAVEVPIKAWDTKKYGDIPADFGRK